MKNIDWIRLSLFFGMGFFLILLIKEWDQFQQTRQATPVAVEQGIDQTFADGGSAVPSLPRQASNDIPEIPSTDLPEAESSAATVNQGGVIRFSNDELDLRIDLTGGDIVQADLLNFQVSLDDDTPFRILNQDSSHLYVAQSGLIGANGTDTPDGRPVFSTSQDVYTLEPGADSISADLVLEQDDVRIIKRFTLKRGEYLVKVDYLIENSGDQPWSAALYAQIKRDSFEPPVDTGIGVKPFLGAAVTTPDDRYLKRDFDDIDDQPFSQTVDTGWVAMLQHYFVSAWIPNPKQPLTYSLRKQANSNYYLMGYTQPAFVVQPGETKTIPSQFYVGPKNQYRLAEISEHLNLTVDYGWLWWAAQPLFWLLQTIHDFVPNWGLSIILLTLCVKAIFFKLSATSYRSMAKMKKLQPKMAALKERHGSDRQAMSQEMMNLYQKEKVNPMGGCLPILVQMPVFIALYWVLLEAVELRHAPFFLWIEDLSAKDPWFILPLIMGASMYVQQKLNPAPPDPTQAKIMQMMPIMFTVLFLWFPAGLVLYWTVNNILSMTQQWYITKKLIDS